MELFDGTGAGTATQAHTLLQGKGFKLAGDTKLSTRSTSVIRYNPADESALALVREALGTEVEAEPDADVTAGHVRVLLGKDLRGKLTPDASSGPSTSTAPKTPVAPVTPTAPPITAGGVPCVN